MKPWPLLILMGWLAVLASSPAVADEREFILPEAVRAQLQAARVRPDTATAAPGAPRRMSLVWQYNPDTMNVTTDAVNLVAPVWFEAVLVDSRPALLSNRANRDYVARAHARNYLVWGTVQSCSPTVTHALVSDTEAGDSLVALLAALVDEYRFDGLNLDFENHLPADSGLLTALVGRIAARLRPSGVILSVDVTRRGSQGENRYERDRLAAVVDYVVLMAYDEHWSTGPENGPVASLDWVEQSVVNTIDEVPPDQLILGVPLYTYDWTMVPLAAGPADTGVGDTVIYVRPTGFRALALDEVWGLADSGLATLRNGVTVTVAQWLDTPVWKEDAGTMYLRFIDTANRLHELWYENEASLGLKVDLVAKYGLAGTAAWQHIFADSAGAIWSAFAPRRDE